MKKLNSHKVIKLYRGLKSTDFTDRDKEIDERFVRGWSELLSLRADGDLSYPEQLNDIVLDMKKIEPFTRQYFTDRKEIAENYAKANQGILIEISVTIKDILKDFIIEFQNYSKRKDQFEIVYIVKGSDLSDKKEEWKMKVTKF